MAWYIEWFKEDMRNISVFYFMHEMHRLKDVNTFNTFKLRKRVSDGKVFNWFNIIRKACFCLLWTFFSFGLWVLAQAMFA